MSYIRWIQLPYNLVLRHRESKNGKWYFVVHPDTAHRDRRAAVESLPEIVSKHLDDAACRFSWGWGFPSNLTPMQVAQALMPIPGGALVVQKPREECIIPLEEDSAMDQEISAETAFSREVVRTMICSVDDTDEVIAKADRIMQNPDVRAFVKDAAAFLTSVRKDRAKDLAESE